VFSEMLSKVRQDYNDLKKEYDIFSSLFSEKQKTISFFNEQKIKNQQIKDQKIETLKNKIKENEERLKTNQNQTLLDSKVKFQESLKKTENAIQKIEEKISKTSESLLEFSKKEAVFHTEIENIEKQIKLLKNKTGICPTCKKKLSDEDDSSIEEHLNQLSSDKNTKKLEFDSISKKRHEILKEKNLFVKKQKDLNDLYKTLNQKIINIDILIKENSTINDKNAEIEESIVVLLHEKDGTEDKIKEIQESVKDLEEKLTEQQQKLNILENSKHIVSEEGVKTHIIKKLLVFFNNKLNFYLKKLEAPCSCNFNEFFEETIVNENKKECSYFNFSGGERKRIDLAILFTFQDILKSQSGVYYSLNMYDELLDSALDESGTNKVLEILKEKSEKYKESIYIISHNPTIFKNNIDNIITLEKINGKTKLVI
jgi:DNA repair exonuclease SbcCD ATPase subunit